MKSPKLLIASCSLLMLALTSCGLVPFSKTSSSQETPAAVAEEASSDEDQPIDDSFGEAVNTAMAAAEAAQTAQTADEWGNVAELWTKAIELMKAVPESSENYQTAQQKVEEYQRNVDYAADAAFAEKKVSSKYSEIHRFYGQPLMNVAENFGASLAQSGDRFTSEDETAEFYAESSNGESISYVEVGVKSLGPCQPNEAIGLSKTIMALGDVPSTNKVRETESSGYVTYRVEGLTVKTSCLYDGDWYTISVSADD
ncbi:uncharacterized protein XM38_012250 [Halomicronema hongdechloris C2206]|uniref:Lipoprotein n=1 Tax=Halomicronema hongdechloris C2206 TaxID=1641165 RepID=A0A1Z3HJ10_9CYAN|nr:hypothetical protein [Halomicronema hongdechloris]ASC70288.1 uncharacterized protein XM38_012250 [Halomicronema hongdechloris C2206]